MNIQTVKLCEQNQHDSKEDAKAALAVYKFKSEILDRHGMNIEESDFSLVYSLAHRYPNKVTLIGPEDEIAGFREYGFKTDEIAENKIGIVIDRTIEAINRDDVVIIAQADIFQQSLISNETE